MKGISFKLREELNLSLRAHDIYNDTLLKIRKLDFSNANDSEILRKSTELRQKALLGEPLENILPEVFALSSEASTRTLRLKPHDPQILAAIALHEGHIIQMQTGEGKTLSAVLPAVLNAFSGRGVHILTFNDYLAKRDAEWMGPIYRLMGLSVGFISQEMSFADRKAAYLCDITYVSAKEAGFDYLRDFLCLEQDRLVHKPFNYAVVDEADSMMIDESRIPLVISGRFDETEECAYKADRVMRQMQKGVHFETDQYSNNLYFTDQGHSYAEALLKIDNLYDKVNLPYLVALQASLNAYHLLKRDRDYIVRTDKIEIIDEFTGRVALRRLYPDSVQTAVEIKEGLKPQFRGRIMGRIAVQHFLSLYPKLSGMTGTAKSASFEFKELYKKSVIEIEPNKPCQRFDHPDRIFYTLKDKETAILDEIVRIHEKGQPILIGTGSIEESESLSQKLKLRGINCEVLNARHDEEEARIIAEAGRPCQVTVSTNMAGRGVDIRLGGSSEAEKQKVMALGGLYILGTRRYESVRIDDQLKGRAGRQGEPGESQFFISLEDELVKKYNAPMKTSSQPAYRSEEEQPFSHLTLDGGTGNQAGEINDKRVSRELQLLQKRVEGYHSDIRMQLIKYSVIMEQQRRILHSTRQNILTGIAENPYSIERLLPPDLDTRLVDLPRLNRLFKKVVMMTINRLWMDYLDELEAIREGIHLVAVGNKSPLDEFNRAAIQTFDKLMQSIETESSVLFAEALKDPERFEALGQFGPSSTFTYLLEESFESQNPILQMYKMVTTLITEPLFTIRGLLRKLKKVKPGNG